MNKYDIVFVLKNGTPEEELKYSIRSIEKNFIYNKIWFYGGKPKTIEPDKGVYFTQTGNTKAERVINSLKQVCVNPDITENFWLFNDDFFIMSETNNPKTVVNCSLEKQIRYIENKRGGRSVYTSMLRRTKEKLLENNYDCLSYNVHIPMLINKEKAIPVLNKYPDCSFRSIYGNIYSSGEIIHPDVKIVDLKKKPDKNHTQFLSTNDLSFINGEVGKYIRNHFQEKSKYEL